MAVLKLYSPHELAVQYFKSFGMTNDAVLQKAADDFLRTFGTADDADVLFDALDELAYKSAAAVLGQNHLGKSELIGYFKMLCLSSGLKDVNFFEKMNEDEFQELKKRFSALQMQGAPTLCPSEMVPQKIKVYKPLLPLKKRLKHLFKRGKKHVRK